ncbi:MAG: serine/threonine-protein kinase [Gemmataceae bacterium]
MSYLIRKGAIAPDAANTIGMIAKGYLKLDPRTLLKSEVLSRMVQPTPINTLKDIKTEHQIIVPVRNDLPAQARLTGPSESGKKPSRIGKKYGRCLITRLLGEGGGGTVYEGLHQGLGIPVAIKVLKDGARGHSIRQALRAEARLLAHLDHPNIVRVYDFDDEGDEPFLIMELVNGQTLADLIQQMGPLRMDYATNVILQVARGLKAAWSTGVVHRDVKPSNILISKAGTVKLADLGLAVAVNRQLRTECDSNQFEDSASGTYAYMAPERFSAHGNNEFTADLYSLGITFFETVTGRTPYKGNTPFEYMVAHASTEIPDARHLNSEVNSSMSRIIAKLMSKKVEQRYASYTDLIADLVYIHRELNSKNKQ